mmetsp:Transcript_118508/g.166628  ORF Transcript_118508/g.166628 Transcript_118508/m.166628 type:complete len:226 (+) Transcript_118508:422-1099(+)
MAEGHDLHGDGEARAKAIAKLGLVDDDDELLGAHLHDLLPEECPASTLHEVQSGIHLVCTIDGHIQVTVGVQGRQRNAQALRLLLGADGGRDGDDVLELSRLQLLTNAFHSEGGGGACAETDHRATLHVVIHGLVANHLFEFILAQRLPHRLSTPHQGHSNTSTSKSCGSTEAGAARLCPGTAHISGPCLRGGCADLSRSREGQTSEPGRGGCAEHHGGCRTSHG